MKCALLEDNLSNFLPFYVCPVSHLVMYLCVSFLTPANDFFFFFCFTFILFMVFTNPM